MYFNQPGLLYPVATGWQWIFLSHSAGGLELWGQGFWTSGLWWATSSWVASGTHLCVSLNWIEKGKASSHRLLKGCSSSGGSAHITSPTPGNLTPLPRPHYLTRSKTGEALGIHLKSKQITHRIRNCSEGDKLCLEWGLGYLRKFWGRPHRKGLALGWELAEVHPETRTFRLYFWVPKAKPGFSPLSSRHPALWGPARYVLRLQIELACLLVSLDHIVSYMRECWVCLHFPLRS